jgi:glycosyltransferase involved in cell wall biosynthesis
MTTGKIRIAIVVSHPIQHFCPQYASFCNNADIEMKVFFGSALGYKKYLDENFNQEIRWNHLRLDEFPHVFLNGEQVLQPDKKLDAATLEEELEKFQPDILFTYGYFQQLQRRAYRWASRHKVSIAYISDSELRHREHPLKKWLKSFFLRKYFSRVAYFLTMGDANEAYYLNYGVPSRKLLRMHYPIDVELYRESFLQKDRLACQIRKKYGINENEAVLAVVGKLVAWKNQDHLIDAMHLLEKEGIYAHLFVIGSGNLRGEWKEKSHFLNKSRVHFTGFVNAEELPSYYAATDIYVHPASLEPHSVAISEAVIMGCPVILSDRCGSYGPTDDVQEGKNGFVYEFGNVRQLSEKIKELISDEKKRSDFASYSHRLGVKFQENSHIHVMENLVKRYRTSRS